MQELISDVHHPIDPIDISEVRVGSKVVAEVNLCLFWSGTVLAVS